MHITNSPIEQDQSQLDQKQAWRRQVRANFRSRSGLSTDDAKIQFQLHKLLSRFEAGVLGMYRPIQKTDYFEPKVSAPTGWLVTYPDIDSRAYRTEQGAQLVPKIVLLPGFAFDHSGVRLGHGGGWFDQYLAAHSDCIPVGIGYNWQFVRTLPRAAHDRYVHYVVTSSGIVRTGIE